MGKRKKQSVRVGLVQWKMRPFTSIEEIFAQAEYYLRNLSRKGADFAVFPEYFMMPLTAHYPELSEAEAMQQLAKYTSQVRTKFSDLATRHKINIITGSMPQLRDGRLFNIGFLCHRDGKIDRYIKIHIPPAEVHNWKLNGGDKIQTFSTDCGEIGILICYDVEFPELSIQLAEQGMDMLFVPFFTSTQNGYYRVRNCARARAIESESYVLICGAVGNQPQIKNMDTHYSQSAIFTPCDYAFPADGIQAEAIANAEMLLIADLDLNLLDQLHNYGSVQILKDRIQRKLSSD